LPFKCAIAVVAQVSKQFWPIVVELFQEIRRGRKSMKAMQLLFAVVLVFVLFTTASFGQQSFMDEPGIPAFTTAFPVEHGFINLANGNLHIEIPIATYPQRGNIKALHARLVYDSRFWSVRTDPVSGAQTWQQKGPGVGIPVGGLFRLITDGEAGITGVTTNTVQCGCINFTGTGPCQPQLRTTYSNFTYQEPNGTTHRTGDGVNSFKLYQTMTCPGQQTVSSGTAYANDASGYKFVINNFSPIVYAPDGTQVAPVETPGTPMDTNGNFFTQASGQVFHDVIDTLGRTPVVTTFSGSQTFLDYLCEQGCNPANGDRARVILNTESIPYATHFNYLQQGTLVGEYSGSSSALASIVFPDGSSYQFQYDSYGQITGITLPTGGQISYTYDNFSDFTGYVNRWVTSRTVDGNKWNFTIVPFVSSCTAMPCPQQVTVTTPSYNDGVTTVADTHVYTFSTYNGDGAGAWLTQVQYFRGAASGNPIVTKTTDYGLAGACPATPSVGNTGPLVVRDTLSWPAGSGTLSKKAEYCYDIYGNKTTIKEWDYQPNGNFAAAPDREVDTTYKTDPAYVGANIINLPLVSTSFGSGHAQSAQTTYGYDETGLQPSGVTTHLATPTAPRANLTSVTKWLNTSTSPVVSTTAWYDSGEVYQSKDPLVHTTTTYFDSTGAYPNRVCNALNQCAYQIHDFNTGLMTSFTDMNGAQAGDPTHTTTYTFDTLLRLLCTNAPDGGQTCLSYPDANHDSRQQIITASLPPDTSTTVFDGLGRVSQTQHTLPACISKVDTTYDPVGAPLTVSNPYCTTADPTYGITQSFHDALGRGVKTIRQDGSVSSSAYSVRNSGTANGTCVTSTDEAGKQRMACHNGFGELAEVDEPSGVLPQANYHALMQQDGNFVLLNSAGTSVWSTGSAATNAASIFMQDDGNLVTYIFKWQAGVYAAPTPGSYPNSACSIGTYLVAGEILPSGKCIVSPHGQYFLLMNTDGNFFIYDWAHGTGTWGPGTQGHPGAYAIFQTDGNLVVYDVNGTALWNSGTSGTYAERLDMNDDGRIIIWKSAWNSGTSDGQFNGTTYAHPSCDVGIGTGTTGVLGSGQCFVSPNGRFELLLQADGNMVIYDRSVTPSAPMWYTGTGLSTADPSVAYRTLYSYDALGNLTCVEQHGDAASGTACPATPPGPTDAPVAPDPNNAWRRRLFAYDSLSRLRWASNPESGVITYAYDADGELLQKTSPLANQTGTATQTVSYCYDPLHRVTGKGYGAQSCPLATPVVSYAYDSGANAKGHLTSLIDQAGTATFAYDILGRLAAETRPIAGISKSTSYTYNLDGSLKTLTYPSGRVVTYTPDSAGRLVSAVDANGTNYVVSASYNPDSSLKSLLNGSTPALSQNFQYTPRLQLCRITTLTSGTLPTSCTDTQNIGNIMDRGYDFHAGNGTVGSGADNGNVFAITNYRDANRSQAFIYDALNRLTSGWSSANTGSYSWGENYSIDAWGNLQITPMSGKAHGGNFTLSGNAQNRPTGLNYDAAGNLLSYLTANYTYDQENRLLSTAGTTYTYDGNGERVLKSQVINNVLTPVKRYWSMGGNTLAEGDGTGNLTAEYIYFGSKRVARIDLPANTVHYYLSDHLGSTSIVASASGTVEEESDYYPFGTEVIATGPGANELKFTGKRRDTESQLDYFGARYYSNAFGRFTTADLPFADQHKQTPQTWNLYTYGRNNPLGGIDPNGRGYIDLAALVQSVKNWWNGGVARDGGEGNFAKNNGIGGAKGTGLFGLNTLRTALSTGTPVWAGAGPGAMRVAPVIPTPAVLKPSNQTQAQASTATQVILTAATAAIPLGGPETAAAPGTTSLFRAVMPAEAQSIGELGAFTNPLGIESKYFSTTLEGAQSYASQASSAFGDGPFSFFSTEIPTSAITPEMTVTVDRGVSTVVVSTEDLTKLSPPKPVDVPK
jgi:RHS repeat-associated protein